MPERTCTVNGCDDKHKAKGLCQNHYYRWRIHGDPLGGRAPNGAPTAFVEMATTYEADECLIWPYSTRAGYGVLVDGACHIPAHRRVLQLVTGRDEPDMDAAHAPGVCHNRACCNPRHLRWATPTENQADRVIDGTHRRGSINGMATLTESEVLEIRDDPRTQRVIAVDYGVGQATVSEIKNRKRWAWLAP